MDKKTIYSKTGKGVLEIKNKAGKLPKELLKVLTLIDGKSTIADLLARSKLNDGEMNKVLGDLTTGGYIKEFANTSTGTQGGAGGSYVDDLDFTSSLSPSKNVYQNAQTEWRQRESADRAKAEQDAKRKREEEDRLKKEQSAQLAREEGARLAKVEAERKLKEAAAQKLRNETERKAKVEADVMAQTQRDLSKILEAERQAFELAEHKKLEEQQQKANADAERRNREDSQRKLQDDESQRRQQEEARKRKDEEERKRKEEEDGRKRDEAERSRKAEQERVRAEEERKRKEEERKRKEEEDSRRREEEERKRKEEEERKRREEDERRKREEEERKRKEEEERKRRAEEERRREEEEGRKRREEEERRKREEVELKRKEEEERRKREEDERKRKEEQERIRAEEERKRKEEEERHRREEQEKRARREEEDRRRREEDERRRREDAQAQGGREEEETSRPAEIERREREASERASAEESRRKELAQRAASDKNDLPEFDLSGLRAMETQVAAEFEKQQQELRKREEEEERQREQQEQARLTMERAEREEQARAEAERRESEDMERRERMERERMDREQREKKRQEEKEVRAREQEEAKVKREQERLREESMKVENERRGREDDLVRRRKEQEERDRKRAEVDALKKTKAIKTPLDRLKPVAIVIVVLVAVILGGVQLMPMNSYVPAIEKLATGHIKEPVSIGSMRLSILDGLTINLTNVKVGLTQDVKIGTVSISPDIGSLFGDVKVIRELHADSLTVAEEVLPRLPKWLDASAADSAVQVDRVVLKSVKLETRHAKVPPFDADLRLSREGAVQNASLTSSDGKLKVELTPRDNQIDIALSAAKGWVPPLGPPVEFSDLTVQAVAVRNQIRVDKFEALLYGGAARGSALINWGGPWSLEGDVATDRVSLQELMAVFTRESKATGQLESKFRYAMASQGLAALFDSPRIDGNFSVKKGDVDGVDLVRALQSGGRGVTQGGATRFEEINGTLGLAAGRYQYRNMKLSSGLLSANGAFDVSQNKEVNGRIAVELRSQAAQIRGNFAVEGELKAIVLRPN